MGMEHHEVYAEWEQHGRIDQTPEEFMEWLQQQDFETWHAIASSWNYDYGLAPIHWIVSQPACDFGTAVQVFGVEATNWLTTPSWEDLSHKNYQLSWKACDLIVKRWQSNDFANAGLKLSQASDGMRTYRIIEKKTKERGEHVIWNVPESVDKYTGARQATSKYTVMNGSLYWEVAYWAKQKGYPF
jgi:hypothetical protein